MVGAEHDAMIEGDVVDAVACDGVLGESMAGIGAKGSLQPIECARVERARAVAVDARGWGGVWV
jgi:hypothetical protein